MKVSQLLPSIRFEVEKPFEEKLRRAKELIHIFGGLARNKGSVSCSFGKDSMVVLWLCRQEFPEIAVIFNNTGVQYKETYEFKERIKKEWDLNLIETKPIKSFWEVAKEKGLPDGSKYDPVRNVRGDSCCYYLKEKPFLGVMRKHGFKINFTGTTALESRVRMWTACQRGMFYYSKKEQVTRINPIIFWTPGEVLEFSRGVQIPLNPAYQKYGLERLGCVPCTSHKFWREQLVKTNPKMYEFIQQTFFHQRLLEVSKKQ
jgi:phosphoadenosine phosphosulfate reductase